jgi:hypothetical protein
VNIVDYGEICVESDVGRSMDYWDGAVGLEASIQGVFEVVVDIEIASKRL